MTYHLEPWIEKITSPVILLFPDGTRQKYEHGAAIAVKTFSEFYRITTICAVDNRIEIVLESNPLPDTPTFF